MASKMSLQQSTQRWSTDTLDDGLDALLAAANKVDEDEVNLQRLIQDCSLCTLFTFNSLNTELGKPQFKPHTNLVPFKGDGAETADQDPSQRSGGWFYSCVFVSCSVPRSSIFHAIGGTAYYHAHSRANSAKVTGSACQFAGYGTCSLE